MASATVAMIQKKRSMREAFAELEAQLTAAQNLASVMDLGMVAYLISCAVQEVQDESKAIRVPPPGFLQDDD